MQEKYRKYQNSDKVIIKIAICEHKKERNRQFYIK